MFEQRGNIDWEKIKSILVTIQLKSPDFIFENALIGGGAAWFYRSIIEQAQDIDFRINLSNEQQSIWFSKDIDFIGSRLDEYETILGSFLFSVE